MIRKFIKAFRKDQEGAIAVEFAFLSIILATMMIGALDYGLAYAREMSMANAVRAGTQFALARKPSIGPDADADDSIISQQDIRDAVVAATPFLSSDPGTSQLQVTVFCECSDGSTVTCLSSNDVPLSCTERVALLQVTLTVPYELTLSWIGFTDQLTLTSQHVIRLT